MGPVEFAADLSYPPLNGCLLPITQRYREKPSKVGP
jgi:hypothetical protein